MNLLNICEIKDFLLIEKWSLLAEAANAQNRADDSIKSADLLYKNTVKILLP
jgi:hypothetical protein